MFNPNIYIADFGNSKWGFLRTKLIQKSNFRVQGLFFNNVIEKSKTRHTLNKAHLNPPPPPLESKQYKKNNENIVSITY